MPGRNTSATPQMHERVDRSSKPAGFSMGFDIWNMFCQNVKMSPKSRSSETDSRRASVLNAARWCFLNFGFAKTTFEDVARRAGLSRTLLYRIFKNKEDIYQAVFVDWLVSRQPEAKRLANRSGEAYQRLLSVCDLMVLEPWQEMVNAPMGGEFLEVCQRIDPGSEALYRKVMYECVASIIGDHPSAEVFLFALDGLFGDHPSTEVLRHRTEILAARFASPPRKKQAL